MVAFVLARFRGNAWTFIYLVRDRQSGAVVFLGLMPDPSSLEQQSLPTEENHTKIMNTIALIAASLFFLASSLS